MYDHKLRACAQALTANASYEQCAQKFVKVATNKVFRQFNAAELWTKLFRVFTTAFTKQAMKVQQRTTPCNVLRATRLLSAFMRCK